jgi:hypothetical protein
MSQKSSFTQPSRFVSQALTPNTDGVRPLMSDRWLAQLERWVRKMLAPEVSHEGGNCSAR